MLVLKLISFSGPSHHGISAYSDNTPVVPLLNWN